MRSKLGGKRISDLENQCSGSLIRLDGR